MSATRYREGVGLVVRVSEADVNAFADQWPCSGLRGLRGVTFEYDPNGDLAGVTYKNGSAERWDGEGLAALADDAQVYGSLVGDRGAINVARERFAATHYPWWWPDSWRRRAATQRRPR